MHSICPCDFRTSIVRVLRKRIERRSRTILFVTITLTIIYDNVEFLTFIILPVRNFTTPYTKFVETVLLLLQRYSVLKKRYKRVNPILQRFNDSYSFISVVSNIRATGHLWPAHPFRVARNKNTFRTKILKKRSKIVKYLSCF